MKFLSSLLWPLWSTPFKNILKIALFILFQPTVHSNASFYIHFNNRKTISEFNFIERIGNSICISFCNYRFLFDKFFCSSKRFAKVILNIQIECIHNPHAGNSICFFTNITVIFHHLYLVCTLKLHWQRPYFY